MKNALTIGAALMLTTTAASAAGIDRSLTNYGIMFEEGNYVELGYSNVRPDVTGDYPAALGGGSTGDMATDYTTASLSLKYQINEQLSAGLFLNQPFGADAAYSQGLYDGLAAEWDSNGIAVVLRYQINPNVSVYGGVRSVESQPEITIPDSLNRGGVLLGLQAQGEAVAAAGAAALAEGDIPAALAAQAQGEAILAQAAAVQAAPGGSFDYTAETEADRQNSYIAGVAYERPDIALRVALTYEGGFTHTFATTETLAGVGVVGAESETEIEMPRSLTLDFQSGVAADTLVFGSIRYSEWSVWEVRPAAYEAFSGGNVTDFDDDTMTYRIGVGRRLNDQFSVFGRVTYEDGTGGVASRLAPTDGSTAFGVGGTYTQGNIQVTGGVEYVRFGDTEDSLGVEFSDNDAVGVGISVGYTF